jgi:amidophosphoribosyltransferase
MASREELVAADRPTEAVCETIGADSLAYLSMDAVAEAVGTGRDGLCTGCVTGAYPYDVPGERRDRETARPEL